MCTKPIFMLLTLPRVCSPGRQQQLLDAAVGEEGGGGRAAEGAAEGAAAGAASPSHGTEHVARRRRELLGVLEKAFRQSCTKVSNVPNNESASGHANVLLVRWLLQCRVTLTGYNHSCNN